MLGTEEQLELRRKIHAAISTQIERAGEATPALSALQSRLDKETRT